MKNDELMALRGGFGVITCYRSWIWGGDCYFEGNDILCDEGDRLFCAVLCPGWTHSICVGGEY